MPTKPTIQRINTSMGTIYVFRNPITKAWILNLTLSKKTNLNTEKPTMRNSLSLAYLAYLCTAVALVLFMVGCESPTNVKDNPSEQGVALVVHPFACIESYPVVPDTLIKKLEAYTLKVGDGPRNRCRYSEEDEAVFCKAKSPDTLYVIDTYCPATRQALNELGG